jgi:hypothetical protein
MSEGSQPADEGAVPELEREERRLVRLRRIVQLQSRPPEERDSDEDPDPKEAA